MSYAAYFAEVEAVCQVLDEWVQSQSEEDITPDGEGAFTATWQAVELLSRAYSVLMPLLALDMAKHNLELPDAAESP